MKFVIILAILAVIWIAWRLLARRAPLPCPAKFAWLVKIENPLARAIRSETVVTQLDPQPGARVIDIGCGPGRVTVPLARAVGPGGAVIALDVQAAMLAKVAAYAKKEAIANIQLIQSDVRSARIGHDTLDAAVMVTVLGELPDAPPVLAAIYSALKPGGRLLVAETIFDPHFVSRRRLRKMAQAAGFVERAYSGSVFGYNLTFERPRATVAPRRSSDASRSDRSGAW
jgi:ubiquinone/menaquinone biosynthesis C-methylase UbiE